MSNLSEKIIIDLGARAGLSDRELADRILGRDKPQQSVNAKCRGLAQKGIVERRTRDDGRIGNFLSGTPPIRASQPQAHSPTDPEKLSEDSLKRHLAEWLIADKWVPEVRWGKDRGIDIDARRDTEHWIIEVKGIGAYQQMRVNYFLGALAEVLQRMDDPVARYSVAFPDVPQYQRLWARLPQLAKQRTGITALFVSEDGIIQHREL